jgi:hypothetical protein
LAQDQLKRLIIRSFDILIGMVKPEIVGENLILRMEGMDKIWAFRSELTIPLMHITDIRTDADIAREWWHGLRLLGSNLPGVITAGTFYQDGKRVFWDVHHPDVAVVISLADESYKELVIEVEHPDEFVGEIKRVRKL